MKTVAENEIKVSVCVATYNGEKFIKEQINSILNQLAKIDEVIISDDSSSDRTVEIIKAINDPRIKIFENNEFRSPIYNFGNALSKADGDIIFLADQDDIWLEGKVLIVKEVFAAKSDVTLVCSNGRMIDENGNIIQDLIYSSKYKFCAKLIHNIIKNKFLGCTLVVRKNMLPYILPFPNNIPMHDIWIGFMNEIYGRVYYIDKPLILYRKHGRNFSPSKRTSVKNILLWRYNIIKQLLITALKHFKHNLNIVK